MKTIKILSLILVQTIFNISSSAEVKSNKGEDKTTYKNFTLSDYNGKSHSLESFANKKGIVIIFIATQCPVSNAYNSRMAELHKKYKDDFAVVGINSNKQEDIAEIKKHAAENNFDFVILKDPNNIVADKFKASFNPEVYVLNNKFEQLYHGRIDDSRRAENVEIKDLENALNEIKKGKSVSVAETKAFGCKIKRVSK